ncbi:6-hydroxy-D-nicotine oxidase [Apiospora aurea]|uniref:6-hydroxy-D-nicotine oxidase n=1 Tax=Apiospora aurea TaxID=335848 RepID=A0ABR1Q059_9PEZI
MQSSYADRSGVCFSSTWPCDHTRKCRGSREHGRSETCVQEPRCVFQPKSASDVGTRIQILDNYQAKFAVRSGINAELYKDVYSLWLDQATAVHKPTGANQTFVIQHVSANVAQWGRDNGGNPLGLPLKNHQWWTTLVDWTDAEDDEAARSAAIATVANWGRLSQARGLDVGFRYMNDASLDQSPLSSYGEENIEKLKQVLLKYDPSQLFQNLQSNGFLLSRP